MSLSTWRLSARLARRDVGRRPGRTVLVAMLIAVPVLAMTVADVLARTSDATDDFARRWGAGTDLVVSQPLDEAVDLADDLPAGATVSTSIGSEWLPIEVDDGTVVTDLSMESPDGVDPVRPVEVGEGRLPESDDEAWVSDPLADALGVDVGDSLRLLHPSGTWTVVGTGRVADGFDSRRIVLGVLPTDQFGPGTLVEYTLVDLPPGVSPFDVGRTGWELAAAVGADDPTDVGASVEWRDRSSSADSGSEELAWGWVAGVLALAAVGIVIAAAFATSARRQLVTVGLLSSNGAPESVVRRTLALSGSWTGLIGSAVGVVIGVIVVLAGRSRIESWQGSAMAEYRFVPLDLVVIFATGVAAATLAALVPARTASRVPVMAALAGRRPLPAVPRRMVPVGLGLFGFGIFLLVVAASGNDGGQAAAGAAVAGGLLVLAGTCCVSPLAVQAMSEWSAAVGRSWRFAGRSLGRTRTRSAAVVTAIAVTGAVAVVASAAAVSAEDGDAARQWPLDAVVVSYWNNPEYTATDEPGSVATVDYAAAPDRPLDPEIAAEIDGRVPAGDWYPRRVVTWDAPPFGEDEWAQREQSLLLDPGATVVVADEATMDLYELSGAERERLRTTGTLVLNSWPWPGDLLVDREITIETTAGDVRLPVALRTHVDEGVGAMVEGGGAPEFTGVWGTDALMMTEATAQESGLEIVESGGFLRSDAPLTAAQRDELWRVGLNDDPAAELSGFYLDVDAPAEAGASISVQYDDSGSEVSRVAVQAAIIGAALVLTLLVVAIGLSLAAVESRDERDVLVAVGARPATLRSMAGAKAVVMTLTGVVLAVPTGLIPMFVVTRATDERFRVPWLGLTGLLVVVPALAGAAAWATSAVAQWARPMRMSTLATD